MSIAFPDLKIKLPKPVGLTPPRKYTVRGK